MSAYVVVELEVHDPDGYEPYKAAAEASVIAAGGRYLVRGGPVEALEGDPPTGRVVILEFPDLDTARSWYSSGAYQAVAPIRQAASSGRMFLIDGWS